MLCVEIKQLNSIVSQHLDLLEVKMLVNKKLVKEHKSKKGSIEVNLRSWKISLIHTNNIQDVIACYSMEYTLGLLK